MKSGRVSFFSFLDVLLSSKNKFGLILDGESHSTEGEDGVLMSCHVVIFASLCCRLFVHDNMCLLSADIASCGVKVLRQHSKS